MMENDEVENNELEEKLIEIEKRKRGRPKKESRFAVKKSSINEAYATSKDVIERSNERQSIRIMLDKVIDNHENNARGYGKELNLLSTPVGCEFVESIKAQGVLQPVLVRNLPSEGEEPSEKVEVIAGFRRVAAAKLVGLIDIPAIVIGDDESNEVDMAVYNAIENVHRCDLKPAELGYALSRIKKLSIEAGSKMTNEEIAQRIGMSVSTVSTYVRLTERLIPEIIRAWRGEGGLSLTTMEAGIFAPMPPEDQRKAWKEFYDGKSPNKESVDDEEKSKQPQKSRMVRREVIEDVIRQLKRDSFADNVEAIQIAGEWVDSADVDDTTRHSLVFLLEWVTGKRKTVPVRYITIEDESDESE